MTATVGDWLDTPGDVLAVIGIVSAVFGVLFWIIDSRLNKVMREFQPNGGASVRDALDRIERKVDAVEAKVANHIDWHMNQPR